MIPPAIDAAAPGWAGRWVRVRLLVVATVFAALFALLGQRAYVLQIRESERLKRLAEDQYLKDIELPARRGRILDRSGAELAASVEVDSVYANPRQVAAAAPGGIDGAARALARPLAMEPRDLVRHLDGKRYFAWIKRHILPEQARAVRDLAVPGVYIVREPRRYYPNRERAGPLLGWAGVDGRGLEGIELYRERELRGTPAEVQGLRDALGREVLPAGAEGAMGHPGADVVTTIDKFIQYRLEVALEAGVERNHARAATAVALDPQTGEVLAMASVPTLNPNDPSTVANVARSGGVRNRAVTDPFEPGSTMKTFSITAAIEAGIVRPDDPWYCENGRMQVGSATIHDAEPIGDVTTTGVLAKSSNICTAKIARKSGRERVEAMLRRFGFGAPTGVDLPGERSGILRPVRRWGEIELATISFGQGVTATPLQVASGYAAIAAGGVQYRPHVTRRVVDERGRVLQEIAPEGRRVISPEVAATMRAMLHAVTEKGGTGDKLAIPGYPSAGKTGTAQKVDPTTHRYSTDKWASSFVGFAPLDDPKLLLLVMVDEPSGSHYGSAVAGPIWREVMVEALRYLNVPASPDAATAAAPSTKAVPAGVATASDAATVSGALATVAVGGDDDEAGGTAIPDFTGLSMGEAIEVARRLGLPIEVSGTGVAVRQEPPPGPAPAEARCRVTFAPPG
jgi:cell division protein FtsI (penicillin-binding protein 3)